MTSELSQRPDSIFAGIITASLIQGKLTKVPELISVIDEYIVERKASLGLSDLLRDSHDSAVNVPPSCHFVRVGC